jgi:hypothetical protein
MSNPRPSTNHEPCSKFGFVLPDSGQRSSLLGSRWPGAVLEQKIFVKPMRKWEKARSPKWCAQPAWTGLTKFGYCYVGLGLLHSLPVWAASFDLLFRWKYWRPGYLHCRSLGEILIFNLTSHFPRYLTSNSQTFWNLTLRTRIISI